MIGKKYLYKIYDIDGTYLTTWKDVTAPSFSFRINSGYSDLTVKLGRSFWDFGEGGDVKIGNQLKIYVSDTEAPDGKLIYNGQLTKYHLMVDGVERVEVTFTGYVTEFAKRIVINAAGETKIPYATTDPSEVIRNVISLVGGNVTAESIDNTGLSVSWDCIQNTALEAINRMTEIAPADWYWYVDADNDFNFHTFDPSSPMKLYVGKHINRLDVTKSGESLYNAYFFLGGGSPQLYTKTTRTSSITAYGQKDLREQDERVTVAGTAANRATSFLDQRAVLQMEVTVTVIDSNVDSKNGVDIDSLVPGQAIQILHPEVDSTASKWGSMIWGTDSWGYNIDRALGQPLRIEEIYYYGTEAILKLGNVLPSVGDSINKNTIQLETFRGKDSPTSPAT